MTVEVSIELVGSSDAVFDMTETEGPFFADGVEKLFGLLLRILLSETLSPAIP